MQRVAAALQFSVVDADTYRKFARLTGAAVAGGADELDDDLVRLVLSRIQCFALLLQYQRFGCNEPVTAVRGSEMVCGRHVVPGSVWRPGSWVAFEVGHSAQCRRGFQT